MDSPCIDLSWGWWDDRYLGLIHYKWSAQGCLGPTVPAQWKWDSLRWPLLLYLSLFCGTLVVILFEYTWREGTRLPITSQMLAWSVKKASKSKVLRSFVGKGVSFSNTAWDLFSPSHSVAGLLSAQHTSVHHFNKVIIIEPKLWTSTTAVSSSTTKIEMQPIARGLMYRRGSSSMNQCMVHWWTQSLLQKRSSRLIIAILPVILTLIKVLFLGFDEAMILGDGRLVSSQLPSLSTGLTQAMQNSLGCRVYAT